MANKSFINTNKSNKYLLRAAGKELVQANIVKRKNRLTKNELAMMCLSPVWEELPDLLTKEKEDETDYYFVPIRVCSLFLELT